MENEDKISVSFYVANENKVAVMPESHMKLENFSYVCELQLYVYPLSSLKTCSYNFSSRSYL